MPQTELDYNRLWWQWISGPLGYLKLLIDALGKDKSVSLITSQSLSWRESLRYRVEEHVKEELNAKLIMVEASVADKHESAAHYLIDRFAKNSMQNYQPHKEALSAYMKREGVFANHVVWIKAIDDEHRERWLDLMKDIKKASLTKHGLFVFEFVTSDAIERRFSHNIEVLKQKEHIGRIDTFLLLMTLSSRKSQNERNYEATVISYLCDDDAELAVTMLEECDVFSACPVKWITQEHNGEVEENNSLVLSSDNGVHPCRLFDQSDEAPLWSRLWKAQVESVYHIIEDERLAFVKKYESAIRSVMPSIDKYDNPINHVYDIELTQLVFMTNERLHDGTRRLYISDHDDYERLHFLKSIRNKLAHMDSCTASEMRRLFQGK